VLWIDFFNGVLGSWIGVWSDLVTPNGTVVGGMATVVSSRSSPTQRIPGIQHRGTMSPAMATGAEIAANTMFVLLTRYETTASSSEITTAAE
jgi:hypothetical protein